MKVDLSLMFTIIIASVLAALINTYVIPRRTVVTASTTKADVLAVQEPRNMEEYIALHYPNRN